MIRKKISGVFIIVASVALLQILCTILLARNLTKEDMGLWRLLLTLVEFGALLGLIGIDHAFVRFFSSSSVSIQDYDWKRFLKKFLFLSLGITIIGSLFATFFYNLELKSCIFLIPCIILTILILIFSSFLRAKQKYELAIFFSRNNFIVFFVILVLIYLLKALTLRKALLAYLISLAIAFFYTQYYCLKRIENGRESIPKNVFKNGLSYFGIGIALILLLQTGTLIIGKTLSYKDLAIYTVIASVMRLFEFIQDSAYHVLVPYFNQSKNTALKKTFQVILLFGLITVLFYILFSKILVHFLFAGLYDEGLYLIPYFIGIGFIRTLFVLPASIIGGKSAESTLRKQLIIISSVAIINLYLSFIFVGIWQLKGVAIANLISWSILLLADLAITKKYLVFNNA